MITKQPVLKGLRGLLLCGVASVALAACTTTTSNPSTPLPTYALPFTPPPAASSESASLPETAPDVAEAAAPDDGRFEQLGDPARLTGSLDDSAGRERGAITINLNAVPVADAVQQVLGDILRENYVVETPLSGDVSLQTSRPVTREGALRLLESVLASRGAELVDAGGFYRIIGAGQSANAAGGNTNMKIIAPRYVSAESLREIFNGKADKSVSAEVDPIRNILILRGNSSAIAEAEKLVAVFDVNWMKGMSFASVPVTYSSPSQIVSDLETVLGASTGGPLAGVMRFVPLDRLNTVVVVSPQAEYISEGKAWISRLDRSGGQGGQKLYVIPIQNRAATEVAAIITDALSGDTGDSGSGEYGLRPGDQPVFSSTGDGEEGVAGASLSAVSLNGGRGKGPAARIIADDANNSIVALATPEQFGILENAISHLDAMANQVFLEATIAEVTLTDSLSYGLTWFFQSGEFNTTFSDAANGAVASQFPGFSVLFSGQDGRAALSAVAGITDVKILSAPSLMVLDNRTATLQVGDQVPVVTQSAVSVTNPDAPIVNSVSLRDTGIILNVTPRVNDSGLVILEIDQEVSDVVATQSSGIDSPTIQQRRISTSVSVRDGESVALGGLMRERLSDTKTKVPLLGDVPFLGKLFSTTTTDTQRTELLVMITPRVVRSTDASLAVTDDLVRRMKSIESTFIRRTAVDAPAVPADDTAS
ncbi:MAG: type II secretion system protein GspD [Hyphomonas sp.]|uniref:type II secretion system secretin GspD n=1 Tax=Hyphomonas sp. TaxID=87 RepID=UPI001859C47A|nr:type II secretion system secretin GspD [Hyphomonas sp.]MBA3067968.1 type II secretion system protein GspD [Hyphomonas sp.]MBU3920356.1 type II secretion system secretin GspD [Alphaproteobacteria bacterium]MBU4061306.1 type II secretion system secretin GspD [Alphaproteobacteria bacterium]MBU4162559.1 type II secretion system secretin GspD [Alphaproteobacteria bacterium]